MKIWRGDLADKQGWRQAFTQTKSSAASQDLCQNLRHADFASSGQPGSTDIDEAEDITMDYGIMSVPTLVIFKDGVEVQRMIGVQPKPAILTAVQAALG